MIVNETYSINHVYRGKFEGKCLKNYDGRSVKIEITKGIAEFKTASIKEGGEIWLLLKNMTYEKINKKIK